MAKKSGVKIKTVSNATLDKLIERGGSDKVLALNEKVKRNNRLK